MRQQEGGHVPGGSAGSLESLSSTSTERSDSGTTRVVSYGVIDGVVVTEISDESPLACLVKKMVFCFRSLPPDLSCMFYTQIKRGLVWLLNQSELSHQLSHEEYAMVYHGRIIQSEFQQEYVKQIREMVNNVFSEAERNVEELMIQLMHFFMFTQEIALFSELSISLQQWLERWLSQVIYIMTKPTKSPDWKIAEWKAFDTCQVSLAQTVEHERQRGKSGQWSQWLTSASTVLSRLFVRNAISHTKKELKETTEEEADGYVIV